MRRSGKIPREHTYVVIDEFTMFTAEEWDTIMRRKGNSIIIALGDFEQIRSGIDGTPIRPEYVFNKYKNVDLVEIPRTPKLS